MSRTNLINRVVRKLIKVADEHGFIMDYLNDGEEARAVQRDELICDIVRDVTATDFAKVRFSDKDRNIFYVYFVFDNMPSEMICDHTDNEHADKICRIVHEHFEGLGL